jgi:2-hydroxychromene-2-carboxylate isomerase
MSNTMFLMRGGVAAQRRGVFAAWHEAIYRAVWAEALDLGDREVLGRLLEAVRFPASEFAAAIEQADIKDALRRNTDEAVSRGVFGAPTFFVGGEMFWGNDRLEWVEAALKREE